MKQKKPSRFIAFFGGLFFIINLFAVAWLGLCFAATQVHPAAVRYLSLFSLTAHFALVVNIFFVFFWLFSVRKPRALLSLVALGLCFPLLVRAFGWQIFEKNDMNMSSGRTKVMSWNVHGLGIFDKDDKTIDERIMAFIQKESPDVLCLPEYYVWRDNEHKNRNDDRIMKENGYTEYRFEMDNTLGLNIKLGTAVFSRYPFLNYRVHKLSEYIVMLEADVDVKGQRVRMFFVHLNTFGLSDREKAFIETVKRKTDLSRHDLSRSKSFVYRFNEAFVNRANEADKAAAIIAQSPYPVIVCGDFNDLPTSYTYTRMRGELEDAFLQKRFGLGRTYNFILPTIRIDYILYNDDALYLTGFKTPVTTLSDHNPVIGVFEIKNTP